MSITINNTDLLDQNGLEAIVNENGEVTIKKKEEVLENNGGWKPRVGKQYYTVMQDGVNTEVCKFTSFDPFNDFERRHLRAGLVFPTQDMAEKVRRQLVEVIENAWKEYEQLKTQHP